MNLNSHQCNFSLTFNENTIFKGYSDTKKTEVHAPDTIYSQDGSIKSEEVEDLNRNTAIDDENLYDINSPINIILNESSQCFKTRIATGSAPQSSLKYSQSASQSYISSLETKNRLL